MKISIFAYLDYRHYLSDLFDTLKKERRSFSLRAFARMAGSTSPNFLQLIRNRKLNIQATGVSALAQALDLSKKEESYFSSMVSFDHAATHEEKDHFFRQLLDTREYSNIKKLEKEQYLYFSNWYVPVVRELLLHPQSQGNTQWIADHIVPPVSESKVRKAVMLLLELNLVREENGQYLQCDTAIATADEVFSLAVTQYHKDMLTHAQNAIERFSPDIRDIRGATLGLSAHGAQEVKRRMNSFWKEILDYAATQKNIEQVVQVNMQMFPLSSLAEGDTPHHA